jgi:death-on-curing protein
MKIAYLSLEEILLLHYRLIEDFGGSQGVRDEKRIASVIQAPQLVAFGADQYESLFAKAAVYLRNIIGDHPFIDGNKRTALAACGIFLRRHSHPLKANPAELEDFMLQVAVEHLPVVDIAAWLEARAD